MELITNILKILEEKKISIYKFCKEAGISQTTFHNWKTGTQPAADKIYKILTYLEVTPNELYGYEKIKKDLSDNEQEMLDLFRSLPDREQVKEIGRLEDKVNQLKEMGKLLNSEETA